MQIPIVFLSGRKGRAVLTFVFSYSVGPDKYSENGKKL